MMDTGLCMLPSRESPPRESPPCPACGGTGKRNGKDCTACGGTGVATDWK